jgi:hypothetical protein
MKRTTLITGLLLFTVTATARAQTPPDAADTAFRKGNGLYNEQHWDEAHAAYESAWRLKKSHDIAANMAYAEMKLGRYRDAAEHLAFAVRNWPPTGKADKRDYAIERLRLAKQEVGTLTIQVAGPRADVLVDGALVGQAPLDDDVFVEPGSHTVTAKRAGYDDAKQVVQAAKGSAQTVGLTMVASPVQVPDVKNTQPPPVVDRHPLWPAIVTGGVAVVAVGVGAGLTAVASGKGTDTNALGTKLGSGPVCAGALGTSTQCQALMNDATSHDTLNKAALGAFVAGGALALTAAGLGAWSATGPKDTASRKTSVRLAPMLARGAGGVVLVGAW